jgi:peptidylprolyl isomerase
LVAVADSSFPHLGYGQAGAGGGVIAPGETLIFVVDLLNVA